MGVYIKGMEMPTEGYIDVRIKCNGTASFAIANNPYIKVVEAVPVPSHGRLIDADALKDLYHYNTHDSDIDKAWTGNIRRSIDSAPTVIEAEEGE